MESLLTGTQQVMSIWKLGGLRPRQLAKRVWAEIDHDNLLGRASELAYNFLLALFPLLLFLISLFGLFASKSLQMQANLLFYFAELLPPAAADLVSTTLEEIVKTSSGGKLTFGIVLALWAGSGGMTTLISALNAAYHVRETRSWIRVHLIAISLTLAISLLVIAALLIVLVGGHLAQLVGSELHMGWLFVLGWRILQWPAALAFISLAFATIYYFGPDVEEQHWYWITPGSVVGTVLWLLASFALRAYLHFFNSYSRSYGSLGAVIILLLWFYVTGFTFLIGGEINAQIEHAAARRGHPEAKEPGRKAA